MLYCMFYFTCDRSLHAAFDSWACTRGTPDVEIIDMTSSGCVTSSVTSPFDSTWPLFYRLPIVNTPCPPISSFRDNCHTRLGSVVVRASD